jgi:hypothetical protein
MEIHRKFCRTPKIMKFVPKFKLGISFNGKHLVPHVHINLLGLVVSLLYVKLRP